MYFDIELMTLIDVFDRVIKDMEITTEWCHERDKYYDFQNRINQYKEYSKSWKIKEDLKRQCYTGH